MNKILIADKLSDGVLDIFAKRGIEAEMRTGLKEDELISCIGSYDGLVVRSMTQVTASIIEAGKQGRLKVIGRAGAGVDNIDASAATAAGMIVMNTPGGNSITTAEHALAMMMALARKIPAADASMRSGKWEKSKFMGNELYGKTLGLVGVGKIGALVAERARGLGMDVIGYDPMLNDERSQALRITSVAFDDLLSRSDVISIHAPSTEQTRNMINEKTLARCKEGALLINCARGEIVDPAALAASLNNGHLAGAALDVYPEEPPPADFPLRECSNVILTPHLGASTIEAQEKVGVQLAHQMADYLDSGTIVNATNMPSIAAEEMKILRPYMVLCEKLGSFAGQLTQNPIRLIGIEYCGKACELTQDPLNHVLVASLLRPFLKDINMVNALQVAEAQKIKLTISDCKNLLERENQIRLTVNTPGGDRSIAGTLIEGKYPRVTEIKGIKIELEMEGPMLYIANRDKPRLVGQIGTILGEADINIGHFSLGRQDKGQDALAVLSLDSHPDEAILEQLRQLENVTHVIALDIP